jgi:phage host-nuclease inhibitor protein Gam
MTTVRTPRTVEAATALLEQFSQLEAEIAAIEANRAACIADVNTRCDTAGNELLARREALLQALEPWWAKKAAELTQGKRKSIELGGCIIGTKAGRASLAIDGDGDEIAQKLAKRKWADGLVRTKVSLDKAAILKVINGAYKRQLSALGLSRKEGEETFFVERAEQAGTLAGA